MVKIRSKIRKWEEVPELFPNQYLKLKFMIFAYKMTKNMNCKKGV